MNEEIQNELNEKDFRVVVFGSARTKAGDPEYEQVYKLGYAIGEMGADVVTGGGPGMMEAANKGHMDGKEGNGHEDAHSIGIGIKLPFEEGFNKHLDIKENHNRFSTRLDSFMELSNVVVITPGGIGTLLEFAYTLQLIQVGHICKIPIILMGDMWEGLVEWIKSDIIGCSYADEDDLDVIEIANNWEEAAEMIKKTQECFENGEYDSCLNWDVYRNR
jgi:hypothetical protein